MRGASWDQYVNQWRRTFTTGFRLAHAFRGAARPATLDLIARAFDGPNTRRLTAWALGWALVGSSVTDPEPHG